MDRVGQPAANRDGQPRLSEQSPEKLQSDRADGEVILRLVRCSMSLGEILPEVQALSRLEKIRLIQILAQELEREEGELIEPGRSYPIWSPDRAFTAADDLMGALAAEKGKE